MDDPAKYAFKKSEQGAFIETNPLLAERHPEGVCRSLVAQWLHNEGTLDGAKFKRSRFSNANAENISADMSMDREAMLLSYLLRKIGILPPCQVVVGSMQGYAPLDSFLLKPGLYYVKFGDSTTGVGHAIGVRNVYGSIRVYDPNRGEWSFGDNLGEMTVKMRGLFNEYRNLFKFNYVESFRVTLDLSLATRFIALKESQKPRMGGHRDSP